MDVNVAPRVTALSVLILVVTLLGACSKDESPSGAEQSSTASPTASPQSVNPGPADLTDPSGNSVGRATFAHKADKVIITVQLSRTSGEPFDVTVHEVGTCEPPNYSSTGPQLLKPQSSSVDSQQNWSNKSPNKVTLTTNAFAIGDLHGRAIVLREKPAQPSPGEFPGPGSSSPGPAIACGVID